MLIFGSAINKSKKRLTIKQIVKYNVNCKCFNRQDVMMVKQSTI